MNRLDTCVYRKFDDKGNDVIICLYVDDMLIFGTSLLREGKGLFIFSLQNEGYGGDGCHLGIKIIRSNDRIVLSKSHYAAKYLSVLICLRVA